MDFERRAMIAIVKADRRIENMRDRREFLQDVGRGGLLAALLSSGVLSASQAWAAERNQAAADAKTVDEALRALGATAPTVSEAIKLVTPEIAENGAVVPVSVTSEIPGTEAIALLIEKNPFPLVATTRILDGTEPYISSRVKMQETSKIIVLVRAKTGFFVTSKEVKVTLGGCGG